MLFWGGNLFQQFVIDAWASVEQSNLNWVKKHQKELQADIYSGLQDAVLGDADNNLNLAEHGQCIILSEQPCQSQLQPQQLQRMSVMLLTLASTGGFLEKKKDLF